MHRIAEAFERVFGKDRIPESVSHEEFVALAGLEPEQLTELIEQGRISVTDDPAKISAHEFLKYAFEENLRELGEERDRIEHVLRSLRKR